MEKDSNKRKRNGIKKKKKKKKKKVGGAYFAQTSIHRPFVVYQ
jgi:hypothetical protein